MNIIIKNATIVNENQRKVTDIQLKDGLIHKVDFIEDTSKADRVIQAEGKVLIPGIIDDQVHFREPGLTHKADIATESAAAVAGGVTSFMEMPNTLPPATTIEHLEEKYSIAKNSSLANYSFYFGAANDNRDQLALIDPTTICGIKMFLGSSTGNMLVNETETIDYYFEHAPTLIAIHSEDDIRINDKLARYKEQYGDDIPAEAHAEIRDVEACYNKTKFAVGLAEKHAVHLHVLHISTAEELVFFRTKKPLKEKKLTAEVCAHHLYFDKDDYEAYGMKIKCNPSIKQKYHKNALQKALINDELDIVASDHAPHTLDEKDNIYAKAPSGIPLVQHTFNIMLSLYKEGIISLEKIVEKMCHSPAILFGIEKRGFIKEGYYGDVVLVDLEEDWEVTKENILYKCGWSPFEGKGFNGKVTHTFVNGNLVYENGLVNDKSRGMRLNFRK